MKFARGVFSLAGVWGLLVLSPFYFMLDSLGRESPPPLTHPEFYFGFIAVALAWQIGFLVIAANPIRYRPLMLVAVFEKLGFVATIAVLYAQGSIGVGPMTSGALVDLLLGTLFVAAFVATRREGPTFEGPNVRVGLQSSRRQGATTEKYSSKT